MPIDDNEATDYLAAHLEWDSEPLLTQAKKLRLLKYARAVDANGVSPDGTAYVLTYTYASLDVAIHLGWQWKLATAVELHADDENEIYDHCLQMVALWASKVSGTVIGGTSSGASASFAIPNVAVF
jgi:hypothetical protein